MFYNTRKVAVDILKEIFYEDAYSNIVINQYFRKYEVQPKDKGLITQIVYGTLQHVYYIDYVINKYSKVKTKKMKPYLLVLLRMSIYQLLYLDKIPESAVCDEAVKLIKKTAYKNLSGFVNGVLRSIAREDKKIVLPDKDKEPIEFLSIKYSFPKWLVRMWLEQLKDINEVEELLLSLNQVPTLSLRCNTMKIQTKDLMASYEKQGLSVEKGLYVDECIKIKNASDVRKLYGYEEGYFIIQDESSMLIPYIADVKEGDLVIDVCSAPGGKATGMAQRMKDRGQVIARDKFDHKIALIEDNCQRLGLKSVEPQLFDATLLDKSLIEQGDVVLVDAPCSGLGIIHKKPDIKLKKLDDDIKALMAIQRDILSVASQYVKKDGTLIYSTCTINEDENWHIIQWFLENFPFTLESINKYLPDNLHCATMDKGYIQLLPNRHGTDGFFIARLVRKDTI